MIHRSPGSIARAAAVLAGTLVVLAAPGCGDGPTGGPSQAPGVRVVSGAPASDTIDAMLPQPLVVEVRDGAGKPLPNVLVRFSSSGVGMSPWRALIEFGAEVTMTTDASGQAAVLVRLGQTAGMGRVTVTVPEVEAGTVTADFTVRPGALVALSLAPADSTVYVGGSYALRLAVADRWGNPVPAPDATLSVEGPAAALAGSTVLGQAHGRSRIVARSGARADTAFVSVVPRGTLLAARADGIYLFDLDGAGLRRVQAAPAREPRWLPGGEQLVFTRVTAMPQFGESPHAYVGDPNGGSRLLLGSAARFVAELSPHPSRDGEWVYFGGYEMPHMGAPYRVRPDGTGLSLVPGFTPDGTTQAHPSPSPQGDRVALFRQQGGVLPASIRVLRHDGMLVANDIRGLSPEWSHGDSIAYLDPHDAFLGVLTVMASDGSGRRVVGSSLHGYLFGIDWSPDDRWIVASGIGSGVLELIEVATGLTIPLGYTRGMYEPAWRP